MTRHEWHTIACIDCEEVIAFSFEPIQLQTRYLELRCYLCARAVAQVASCLMPVGNYLSTNSLYGVAKIGNKQISYAQFEKPWLKLFAKLEAHRIAKAYKKSHANK